MEEVGALNIYGTGNDMVNGFDPLGLSLYAFDGTSNDKDQDTDAGEETNVAILWSLYKAPDGEDRFYKNGVGTRDGVANPLGLFFGKGFGRRVSDMFAEFEAQYKNGDCHIDVVGFSRGAAEARDFANRIKTKYPTQQIRWLGLFDTVESVGMPATDKAHYKMAIPDTVQRTIQLVASDEHRRWFPLTSIKQSPTSRLDSRYSEIYVAGAHSDVGGSYTSNRGLANRALRTMWLDGINHAVPFEQIPYKYRDFSEDLTHDSRYWFYDKPLDWVTGRWTWFRGPRPRTVIDP